MFNGVGKHYTYDWRPLLLSRFYDVNLNLSALERLGGSRVAHMFFMYSRRKSLLIFWDLFNSWFLNLFDLPFSVVFHFLFLYSLALKLFPSPSCFLVPVWSQQPTQEHLRRMRIARSRPHVVAAALGVTPAPASRFLRDCNAPTPNHTLGQPGGVCSGCVLEECDYSTRGHPVRADILPCTA